MLGLIFDPSSNRRVIKMTFMTQYRVVVVGMGKRGMHHATAFHANPRFKVVGICDIDKARLEAAAPKLGNPEISTDAAALAKKPSPISIAFARCRTCASTSSKSAWNAARN